MSKQLPFTHLRVELRGLTVAGQVWNKGDFVPLDGSTPEPVRRHLLDQVAAREHPHLTAGTLRLETDEESGESTFEFEPLKKAVELPPEPEAEAG